MPPSPAESDRGRWLALYVLCTGMLMIVVDGTIVNVALPSIQADLGFAQGDLAWVVNAYLIAFGGLLLLAGRVGDLLGQRRVFLVGLGVFTVASALCAAAPSQGALIGARFVQGVGGALTSAVILGMIVGLFPEPREMAKAFGVFGFVALGGGSLGLLAGGILTEAISWHWIFLVNLPIGIVTAALALRWVPSRPGLGLGRGADAIGAVLLTGGLMLAVYGILGVTEAGWGSGRVLAPLIVGVLLLGAFVSRQSAIAQPLVPLRLFRSRLVSGANAVQALAVVGLFGMFFLGALYLQQVLGYSALEVGLAFMPATIVMAIASLKVDELAARFGAGRIIAPSLALIVVGLLLLARAPVDGSYAPDVLPTMILFGLGAGTSFPAITTLAMAGVPQEDSGAASGVLNTSLQVGGAVGLAVLATLSTGRTADLVATGTAAPEALTSGFHLAFLVGAGAIVVAMAISLTALRPTAEGAEQHAEVPPEVEAEAAADREVVGIS